MCFHLPRVTVLLPFAALCLVAAAQAPKPQIAGRVVRADDGLPIEGAAVRLLPPMIPGNGQLQTAVADSNGEYRFVERIRDGAYTVEASGGGFVSQIYSRDGTLEGKFQRIDSSTRLRGIDFRLEREAVIRGLVLDKERKPAASGTRVSAVHNEKRPDGSEPLIPVSWAETDGTGHFVLTKLPSGTYFVCVNGPSGFNSSPNVGGWYREAWYGGTASAKGATPVTLRAGEERTGVSITVERERRYRVVVWPSGPEDVPKPDRYEVGIEGRSHTSTGERDGSYVIPSIPAGHYRLLTTAWSGVEYVGAGDVKFDVIDADVTLQVHVGGLAEVEGVVKSESDVGNLAGVMIRIQSQEGAAQGSRLDKSGRFRFGRVLPGNYRFTVLKQPSGVVLRSVRCAGAEVKPDVPLRVDGSQKVTDCELVLGPEASKTKAEVQ
jgi:Carboxypeptidase regulatory-like domain